MFSALNTDSTMLPSGSPEYVTPLGSAIACPCNIHTISILYGFGVNNESRGEPCCFVPPSTHRLPAPDHPYCTSSTGPAAAGPLDPALRRKPGSEQLLPVVWSTGPPPLLPNRAAYRSGYAFSRATHRSRKWSLSLLISIFKRWSTFSALDEQFWSSSNLSSWLKVPETINNSMTRSASVMDSSKFW